MSGKKLPYTLTNESVTVVYEGKPYVVKEGAPNYLALRKAITEERWDDVPKNLSVAKAVANWSNDKFKIEGDTVRYKGKYLPREINDRIIQMTTQGENPTIMFNFWERLSKNPSKRSVDQLWPFLKHQGIPLTEDGCFLAYKGVRSDYRDQHSGKFLNKPGAVMEMERNAVEDDPRQACDEGFHVGDLSYARSFAALTLVVKVDPKDVVSIPYDSSQRKMRVCRYEVLGHNNGDLLPSVAFKDDLDEKGKKTYEENIDHEAPEEEEEELVIEGDDKNAKGQVTKAPKKRKAHKFDKLDSVNLMERSLDELRNYATYGLDIVGASKIHGGKTALISRILSVRESLIKEEKKSKK